MNSSFPKPNKRHSKKINKLAMPMPSSKIVFLKSALHTHIYIYIYIYICVYVYIFTQVEIGVIVVICGPGHAIV